MRYPVWFAVLSVASCGGSVASSPTTDSAPAADTLVTADTAVVDTAPDTAPIEPTTTRWFAVRKLYLGLTTRTGLASTTAWAQYGYDLDSRLTTRDDSTTSLNSCKRVEGSPTRVLADGDLGRDNNFGQHFMSVAKSLKADIEEAINAGINDGYGTVLLRLQNVVGDNSPSVPGALYIASTRGGTPKWDGSDSWPIEASSLSGMEPRITFPKGSMKGGVWTSGELGSTNVDLPLPVFITTTWIPTESTMISFNTKTGKDGTMAGGAPVAKFVKAIEPTFRGLGICPGSATFAQIAYTIEQSADLKSGAPQLQDPTATCDTMSIGIGFDATPARAPDGVSPTKMPIDECGP